MDALSNIERTTLTAFEGVIEKGLASFVEVGNALMRIRDGRLYRETFGTFEDYCQEKWGMSRVHAHRLVEAASVVEMLPVGNKPASERHARPLTLLDSPEEQAEAWSEAVETAPAGKVTAAHVEQVVRQRIERPLPQPIVHAAPIADVTDDLSTLTGRKFGTIYADPPWGYDNRGTRANVDRHYAGTMTADEVAALPIGELAADDAHLHLWVTKDFIFEAKQVLDAWGFEYKSMFVWVKTQIGIGNYWRVSHELMLLGVRGDAKRFADHSIKSWAEFPRTQHSAKPDEVRGFIERVSPGPYLELFGRKQVDGWTVFGNQVERKAVPA